MDTTLLEEIQDLLDGVNTATQIRRRWLWMLGMSRQEIVDQCKSDPPVDVVLEAKELASVIRINPYQRP